jgi:hypothetical protein
MKGFIKILEVVLSLLLIFGILPFFTSFSKSNEEWDNALLSLSLRDILISLDKSGILKSYIVSGNLNELKNYISSLLPANVMIEIYINGIPKNVIKIGCNCTLEEKIRLERSLGIYFSEDYTFSLRGRIIRLEFLNTSEIEKMGNADVIIFFGCRDLSKYLNYLDEGKAFIMIGNDICEEKIFNITLRDGSVSSYSQINSNSLEPFRIGEYFIDVPIRIYNNSNFWIKDISHSLYVCIDNNSLPCIRIDNLPQEYHIGDTVIIDGTRIKIRDIDADESDGRVFADISIIDRNYNFYLPNPYPGIEANEKTILKTLNGFSFAQLNYFITQHGNGRAVWIKDFGEERKDFGQLLKSIILWASEERFKTETQKINKNFIETYYLVSGIFESEPYLIRLIAFYIY